MKGNDFSSGDIVWLVDLQPLALVDCWRLKAAYNKRLYNQSSTLAVDVRSFSNSDYSNSMADKEENRFSLNLSRLSSGSQISGSTRETTTEKSKVVSQMAEDDLTFPLLALSDVAKARRRYMKVYPNKVYTPWYRRYVNCLPDGQRIDFQPGVEIRKVDEDIALQYFYGEDTPYIDEPTTKESNERRAQTLRRYTKLMEMRERTQSAKSETKQLDFNVSLQSIIAANKSKQPDLQEDFGPTVTQRAKIVPIINFMDKLKTLKMRQIRTVPKLQPNSKWKLFQLPLMRLKLRQYIKSTKQAAIRFRFRRFIQLVRCVYRFIHIISVISGDTKLIIKNVANFVEEQHKNTTLKVGVAQGKTKQIFDASKYKLSKRLQFSMAVKLILTKPWFERSEDEINEVIRTLQVLRSFVEYPSSSQRRLARVAWLIEVPSDKVIIRECHMAQDFYILLRGKAKMTKLSGSAVIGEPGAQRVIKWLKKDMVFGQESMFEPRSERKYTVISTDHCDMLAINIYDYLAMLMTTKDDEEAPEHIAFICTLDLLKDFPKTKLLEEGGENITLYFFNAGDLITASIEKAAYIYVVKFGTARVIAEKPPPLKEILKYEQIQKLKEREHKKSLSLDQPVVGLLPSDLVLSFDFDSAQELEKKMEEKSRSTIFTDPWVKRKLEEQNEKMAEATMQRQKAIIEESKELMIKSSRVSRVFSDFNTGTNPYRRHTIALDDSVKETDSETTASSVKSAMSDTRGSFSHLLPFRRTESRCSSTNMSDINQLFLPNIHDEKRNSNTPSKHSVIFKDDYMSFQPYKVTRVPSQGNRPEGGPPSAIESRLGSVESLNILMKNINQFSKWKHIRRLVKGDYVGHEWLDFNNGVFEPPAEDWSLVSEGCELIMIKKEFLMEYLRKEW